MKTIKIYCKICGSKLTDDLNEISESNLKWEDGVSIMQKNRYAFYKNEITLQNNILTAIDDYYLKNHPEGNRFSGCCGSSMYNSLNKTCKNGHEVATEISDCYTSHYIEFDCDKTTIKVKIDDYNYKNIN